MGIRSVRTGSTEHSLNASLRTGQKNSAILDISIDALPRVLSLVIRDEIRHEVSP